MHTTSTTFHGRQWTGLALGFLLTFSATGGEALPDPAEERPGGDSTHHRDPDRDAFSHPAPNLDPAKQLNFAVGNGLFKRLWVSAPASTSAADGLGPLFNARSCQRCHVRDGRGHPPLEPGSHSESMLFRLSIPPEDAAQQSLLDEGRATAIPDPVYGAQLQESSVAGIEAEGRIGISHEPLLRQLGDGRLVELAAPLYALQNLAYGDPHPAVRISPRVAPQMIGLGLLEAIDETSILERADPDDADGDGISGRPNQVYSAELERIAVGRFGHKATVATLNEQNQLALHVDIGLSTPLRPASWGDCTPAQVACREAPHGGSPRYDNLEAHDQVVDLLLLYTRHLSVPARRSPRDPDVVAGRMLFREAGCGACHQPDFVTGDAPGHPANANQHIWPYTDLLLHDMGDALADDATDGQASGREWRTAPLWGIGLTGAVSGHTRYLHDGRARSLEEAILWHGGEAAAARERYATLDASRRMQLILFVESL